MEFSGDLVDGRFTLAPPPEAFRPDAWPATLPVQFVPRNGPAVVPGWLAVPPPAPRMPMTFGGSVDDGPARLPLPVERLQEILDPVADLERKEAAARTHLVVRRLRYRT
ncbi:hypothetical protein ACICHK_40685 [Streptomyces sp. AHU1]|uniref:hypothetical protein n=1 Tax=Streptomyces sp. AHU1 TaxID=3377215 RepID=UPI003877C919